MIDQVPNATPRERIWDAIHFIEGNQRYWMQEVWEIPREECGSSYCLAGWIVVRAGYETIGKDLPGFVFASQVPKKLQRLIPAADFSNYQKKLDAIHVSGLAEALLGVKEDTIGSSLWWGNNTLEDLKELARQHFGPDPQAAS